MLQWFSLQFFCEINAQISVVDRDFATMYICISYRSQNSH